MKNVILKIKSGDKDAFAELYRTYYSKIYQFVYRILRSKVLAEEVTQEVFFRLWLNHRKLDETMSYDSFFYAIAKNISMDIYRKSATEMNYKKEYLSGVDEPYSDDGTGSQMDFIDLQELINAAVDKMPPKQQLIFRLSRTDGLLNEEIAQKLGISKRTVETHISNSLKLIKKLMKQHYMLFFV